MALSAGADQNQTTSRILNKLQYAMTDVAADITTATTSDIIPMLDASDGYEVKYADSANVLELIGTTATATELNYLDITTLGTGAASKAVVLDASGDYTYPATGTIVYPSSATLTLQSGSTFNVAGTFQIGGTAVTATAAEINARNAAASRYVNVTDAATYSVLAADSGKIHIMPDFTASCTLTLPTAAAGLEYTFIGKAVAADAQDWIIKSPSATNYFIGGVAFADTDAGAGADEIHAGIWSNGSSNDFLTVVTPGAGTRIHVICDGTNWIVNGQVFSATVPAFSDT